MYPTYNNNFFANYYIFKNSLQIAFSVFRKSDPQPYYFRKITETLLRSLPSSNSIICANFSTNLQRNEQQQLKLGKKKIEWKKRNNENMPTAGCRVIKKEFSTFFLSNANFSAPYSMFRRSREHDFNLVRAIIGGELFALSVPYVRGIFIRTENKYFKSWCVWKLQSRNRQINYNLIKLNFIWNILFYNSVIVLDCISEIITPDDLSSGMRKQKWLIFQRIIIFSYETFPNQELVWESYISSLSRNYFYNW